MRITTFQEIASMIVKQKSDKKISERINKMLKGGRQYEPFHNQVRG